MGVRKPLLLVLRHGRNVQRREDWNRWNGAMQRMLARQQHDVAGRKLGPRQSLGTRRPGLWHCDGHPLPEVYYRYLPLYGGATDNPLASPAPDPERSR
jgi:hypothetical protein